MIKDIYLDLYNRTFIMAIGESKEAIETFVSDFIETPVEIDIEGTLGCVENYIGKRRTITLIYIRDNSEDVFNMGTIVHECYHAAHYMFKIVGIKIDTDNDDVGAYVIDWIFRQVLAAIRESKEQ